MKKLLPLLALTSLFFLPSTSHAQVDMNALLQKAQSGAHGGVSMEEDKGPFVPNSFVGSFRMEIRSYQNGVESKDSPVSMRYHSSPEMTLMQPEVPEKGKEEMRMLIDLKGKWQYSLMTDKKGKRTGIKMKKMKVTLSDDMVADGNDGPAPNVERTGETRVIEGQTCTKYIAKDKDGVWTAWVAEDVQTPFLDMARSFGGNSQQWAELGTKGFDGMAMETEHVDRTTGEKTVSRILDLEIGEVDEAVFSLDGYEVMEMPAMPIMGR